MYTIKGIIMGLSIAAPVGPIGLLCINRTLRYGRWSGLCTGLGAATADGLYGIVAACGVTAISSFLINNQFWFALVGGSFLVYLGIKTLVAKPAEHAARSEHRGLLTDYITTVFLTITNPMTILTFVAIFAGLGLGTGGGVLSAISLVTGVFIGSALWWLILSSAVAVVHHKFSGRMLLCVNYVSGLIIVILGLIALLKVL